jgi:hypothetical protein
MHVSSKGQQGSLPKNADCDYNVSGYPEDLCMAGDLAAEPSSAGTVDVTVSTVIPKRIMPAVSSPPVHSAYPV